LKKINRHIGSSIDDLFEDDGTLEEITPIAVNRVGSYVTQNSGNVFADLNLPDAEKRLTKARLISKVYKRYKDKNLSEPDLCNLLSISEEKLINLLRGKLSIISLKELTKLNVINYRTIIFITYFKTNRRTFKFLAL
jgi:predicted XRE-type DNA-binding protein